MSKNPLRHHTPDDDPEAGTPGTGEDVCPDCHGTGKQIDEKTGQPMEEPCERCEGTGRIIEGIGQVRMGELEEANAKAAAA